MNAVLYIHGKNGSASESGHYRELFPGCEVAGLDYQGTTPWEAGKEIRAAAEELKSRGGELLLIANSVGAYFSLHAGLNGLVRTAYFISPVVDMEKLIRDMMIWSNVTEEELESKGMIPTDFGEDLSWEYLSFVRSHPVEWSVPTHILYGSGDHLTSMETVKCFAEEHGATLTVMEHGEHWFHTEEQMRFLDSWIRSCIHAECELKLDISRLSRRYQVRRLGREDVSAIVSLCRENRLYYQYCPPSVTEQSIEEDMSALPPGKKASDKYYVGFFEGDRLIAVMDLILGYPREKTAWIGFFMTDISVQNQGIGSLIINELSEVLAGVGVEQIELGWVKGNPQAAHFWRRNRFVETGETKNTGGHMVVLARRRLQNSGGDIAMIETERLHLYAACREQMETYIEAETDEELKKAYTEMLEGCLRHPDQWEWYAMWMIELKDGTHIGDLCFKGLDERGVTEIGYGILEEYQGRGYATEAVRAAVGWAVRRSEVTAVEAETDADNAASQRVLEKCGFAPNGRVGEEGPRFTLIRFKDRISGTVNTCFK